MTDRSRRLRLVRSPAASSADGPGLARARESLAARLGRLLVETGRLADESQDDREVFTQLGIAAQALALAQRQVRKTS